jgi:hypothetical protein
VTLEFAFLARAEKRARTISSPSDMAISWRSRQLLEVMAHSFLLCLARSQGYTIKDAGKCSKIAPAAEVHDSVGGLPTARRVPR